MRDDNIWFKFGLVAIVLTFVVVMGMIIYAGFTQRSGKESVTLILDEDGCKVYRFYDAMRWHYFTNCDGTISTYSCGKQTCEETISRGKK